MKHFYLLCALFIVLSGCGSQPVPKGFPSRLTNTTVTLVNHGQPLPDIAVSLFEMGSPFLVNAITDTAGTAKLKTTINAYSKDGVPAGMFKLTVFLNIVPKTESFTLEEVSKKTPAELEAREKQIQQELAELRKAVPIPPEWEDLSKTPVTLTVPTGGKRFTIDTADPKTFVQ